MYTTEDIQRTWTQKRKYGCPTSTDWNHNKIPLQTHYFEKNEIVGLQFYSKDREKLKSLDIAERNANWYNLLEEQCGVE